MANLGLLNYRSAGELHEEAQLALQEQERERQQRMVESSLSAHIRRCYESAKMAKRDVEQRLLDCARRHKGEYSAGKLAEIREMGGSEVYPRLTTIKTRALAAWVADILMPAAGEPWGLDPTPVSDVPPEYVMAFMQRMQQEDPEVTPEKAKKAVLAKVKELADEAAKRHEALISDQLAEGGWHDALEEFIEDFAVYPNAFMKGPVLENVTEMAWMEGWQPVEVQTIKPVFKRVSPFDIYPSPDSRSINDGSYLIERDRFTRAGLNRMRGVPGYDPEAIDDVLREHGQGGLRTYESIDSERARLEERPNEMLHKPETIEGLHYWGSAQGLMLLNWGMSPEQIDDPLADYEINAILIGRHVIRSVINRNPMGKRPYGKAGFQKVPGSFWDDAVPELMTDIQDICCSVARAQGNNLAFASGPQVEVNVDRLAPGEDPNEMFPLKRWRTKSDRTSTGQEAPAIRFYQPDSRAGELNSVYEAWERRADDATNIPRYAYGNERVGGAGRTMGGLAMLMESANKGIKNAVRHIDRGLIRPAVEALWLHNMRYSDDQSIKGDANVVPRGASAMLIREQVQESRNQFLMATNNEVDLQIMGIKGRARLLRSAAEKLDLPNLIPDDDEIEARQQQQQQAAEEEQMQAQQQAQQLQEMTMQMEQAKLQGEEQERQLDAMKIQADAMLKQTQGSKLEAETRKILMDIQVLLSNMRSQNAGTQPAPNQRIAQTPGQS